MSLRTIRPFRGALFVIALLLPALPSAQAPAAKMAFAEPGISPDGREIAFVSGGDIWTVPVTGGEARLLVSHPATESRPLYAPDGRSLAFTSTRTGGGDLYVLTFETGDLRRLTYDDAAEVPNGWSPDGKWLYFSSTSQDMGGMADVLRIASDGGTAIAVTDDPYLNEFFATASPDGKRVAFSARGIAASQWWRHGHSHIDESEIWMLTDDPAHYEQLTPRGAKALWPMWNADGRSLFFVSDRGGPENLWRLTVPTISHADHTTAVREQDSTGRALTTFTDGRVLWPTISGDGKTIAFERDFSIWTFDTASGRTQPLKISRRGAPAGAGVDHTRLTTGFEDLALSPDGKKVAFVARGDLFAASAKDGGDATRLTATSALESHPIWTSDSRRVIFVAEQGTGSELHRYDFATNSDTTLTSGARDYSPSLAPNGERVAFLRGARELCVVTLPPATPATSTASVASAASSSANASAAAAAPAAATSATSALPASATQCLAKAAVPGSLDSGGAIAWSPDSRWIAFMASGAKSFTNVQVMPAAGGDTKSISFLANVSSDSIAWSPDGTFLLFNTTQRTEQGQVARVDLVLRTPKFREDQFRELFPSQPSTPDRTTSDPATTKPQTPATTTPATEAKDAAAATSADKDKDKEKPAAAAKKPTEIVFDDIRHRLGFLPVGVDVNDLEISPDGKTLLLSASSEGQQNLYTYSLDELTRERPVARQLTSTAGAKSDAQFSPDGKEVYYLEDGRIQTITIEQRTAKPIAVTAELDVDFTAERHTVFGQAWSMLNEHFYDPQFHGANWTAARDRFGPYAAGAATSDELRRITNLMIGELNASHLGISAPAPGAAASSTGRLGVRFDKDAYARTGRLTIANVIPLGPAAVSRSISAGDTIVAVNGTPIAKTTNLDRLLDHMIGKRVTLKIEPRTGSARDVAVQPINLSTERGLVYRAWVESRRAYVAKASGGRLGYVHMPDMSAQSLAQLYIDLDAENHLRDGVVIDIRNNNGGFVNAYALDVFTRKPYLNMTLRGRPTAPARTILGQRALESPTILVTNQHSLSDAEDFTEGYRKLKLGKVVGEPTAGWIIYTWGARLVDGSALRLPRMRITDSEGKDMELAPRPVDVPAVRQLGEAKAGKDTQLDVAVRELLAQLGTGTRPAPTTQSLP